jgi:AraC-like DNA-binding protein
MRSRRNAECSRELWHDITAETFPELDSNMNLETAIRLVVTGQVLLIALLFFAGQGSRSARIGGGLLVLSVAGYLFRTSTELSSAVGPLLPLLSFLSMATPYFLWIFARCVFDSPLPRTWIMAVFVAVSLACWAIFSFGENRGETVLGWTATISRLAALIVLVNTLWLSAVGRRDDLLEKRRRFRSVFVILVSVQAIAIMIVELIYGLALPPPWLSMLNVIMIGILALGLSIPLLRLNEDFFPQCAQPVVPRRDENQPPLSAADKVLFDKLLTAMDAGVYRRTGLTITALAAELRYPEHQVRRLINQHLGFRNFSFFLNSFRIEEATERLQDPEHARTPVLTIALDRGFASLGPFNRAFKEMTGVTPTAYREQAVLADSE